MKYIEDLSYFSDGKLTLPKRPERSNKGDFGRVLCVCGSFGMAGASYLAALGAYRTGTGLVEIFAPEENRIILQTLIPEAVLTVYDESSPYAEKLLSSLERCDSVVIGCGLGRTSVALGILKTVLRNSKVPTVIDADALNLISEHPALYKYLSGRIITPHVKEFSRLSGLSVENILDNIATVAQSFAANNSLICVLKDHRTVVSDGTEEIYINKAGNSGMATGGSGDVLAGVIGALLAQRHLSLSLLDAACLGVYIHSTAGDRAAETRGEYSIMARDIAENIVL